MIIIIIKLNNKRIRHSSRRITEASRQDLLIGARRGSKQRYKKRLNYQISNFKGVDLSELFNNDYFVFRTPINNYEVIIAFPGVLSELKEVVKATHGDIKRVNLQLVIKALRKAFDKTDDIKIRCSCKDFCLPGDMQIKLLDGRTIEVEQLFKEFQSGKNDLWAYSVSDEDHNFRPGHISDVWISGMTDTLIKVTLDNGAIIRTTPNHLYMLRDGTYKRADGLTEGQSLMSLSDNYQIVKISVSQSDHPIPVYDLTVDKYNNFLVSGGIILHNCYRFMYYAWKNDYLYGKPTPGTEEPPKITNPDNNLGPACKHLNLFLSNKKWLTKAASVVNALIKTYPDKAAYYLYDEDEIIDDNQSNETENDELDNSNDNQDNNQDSNEINNDDKDKNDQDDNQDNELNNDEDNERSQ